MVEGREQRENSWQQVRKVLRILAVVLSVLSLLWLIRSLQTILLLVVFSVFFAYLMAPLVELVHTPVRIGSRHRRLSRAVSIASVFLLIGSIGLLLAFALLPPFGAQLADLVARAPEYLDPNRTRSQYFQNFYVRYHFPLAAEAWLEDAFLQTLTTAQARAKDSVVKLVGAVRYLPWLGLIPVIAFFLLKDASRFRRSALEMLPQGRARWRGSDFFEEVNRTLAAFVRAQLIACGFVAVICSLGFWLLGVPYPLLVGVIAGVLEFMPMLGPFAVLLLSAALDTLAPAPHLLQLLALLGTLRLLQDYLVYPRLMGRGVQMHPLAVILTLLCGAELAGLPGVVLAIPATAVFSVGYRHLVMNLGGQGLLAELLRPSEPEAHAPALRHTDLPEPERTPPAMPRLDGVRVLVVDNELDARDLLVVALESCGAQVLAASSAREALKVLQAERPDVLVSDIGMPTEDGFDLIRMVRQLPSERGGLTPAAALTAYGTPEDRARALLAGFQTHVPKPVDAIELATVVGHLATARRAAVAAKRTSPGKKPKPSA